MYGWNDLKKTNLVTDTLVQCPVKDCETFVTRQTKNNRGRKNEFLCNEHRIFISPTTFHYEKLNDNLITKDQSDYDLLDAILRVKTENRLWAERSEDAVVWNVFRTLEKQKKILSVLPVLPSVSNDVEPIYWGYYQKSALWDKLEKARIHFAEDNYGTEPDLILYSPAAHYFAFIEAKLDSPIKQKFSHTGKALNKRKRRYTENEIYSDTILGRFEDVAIKSRFYELLRQWMLGTWISRAYEYTFYHISLVPDHQKHDAQDFQKHLGNDYKQYYSVVTWGEINSRLTNDLLSNYLDQKTLGYKKQKGKYNLQKLIR